MLWIALVLACAPESNGPEGSAFTVNVDIQLAPNQSGLLGELDSLELLVEYATGTERHTLSTTEPGRSAEVIGIDPLDAETIALVGYTGDDVAAFGRSVALTVSEDSLDASLLLLRTDDFAWIDVPGRLALATGVSTGGGNFWLSGGTSNGSALSSSGDGIQDAWWSLELGNSENLAVATVDGLAIPSLAAEDDNQGVTDVDGRVGHTMTLLDDGRVIIAGGGLGWRDSYATSVGAYQWTPGDDSPVAIGSLKRARSQHITVTLPNGNFVLAGGYARTGSTTSFSFNDDYEFFDLGDDEFKQPRDLITAGAIGIAGATLGEDGALLCGGLLLDSSLADPFVPMDGCDFIGLDGQAAADTAMPVAAFFHQMTLLNDGSILMTGGVMFSPGVSLPNDRSQLIESDNRVFRYSSGSWTEVSGMNNPRALHAATLLADGRVLVTGGTTNFEGIIYLDYASALPCAEIYDPEADTWTEVSGTCDENSVTGALPSPTWGPAVAADEEYGVLVVGGVSEEAPVNGGALFIAAPVL